MTTDTMIRAEGTKVLIDALGLQCATRFFTLIQRESCFIDGVYISRCRLEFTIFNRWKSL
jgi:hypothetical protein